MTNIMEGPDGPLSMGPRGPIEPIFAALKTDPRLAGETRHAPAPAPRDARARGVRRRRRAGRGVGSRARAAQAVRASRFAEATALLVLLGRPNDPDLVQALSRGLGAILPAQPTNDELVIAVHRAFELLDAKARAETRGKWLTRYRYESSELVNIARAMTTARDVDKLLGVILEKSRFVTGADAGSIYVAEGDESKRMLRFKLTQNDSVTFDSREFVVPISNRSMAGSAAVEKKTINIADVYELPPSSTFAFDRSFDEPNRLPHEIDARDPAHLAARGRHRRHPAHQQEEGPRQEALHAGRRAGAGRRRSTSEARSSSGSSRRKQACRSRTRSSTTRSGASSRGS